MLMRYNYLLAEKVRGLTGVNELLDTAFAFTAETGAYVVPVVLVVLFLLRGRSREDSLFIFFATLLGIGAAHFVQPLYVHDRPFMIYDTLLADATGDTFPSQHASTLFPFSLAFLYRGRRRLGAIFLGWAVVNAFSRVTVGYHFPLDILAGFIIGVVMVWSLGQYQDRIEDFSGFTEELEQKALGLWNR